MRVSFEVRTYWEVLNMFNAALIIVGSGLILSGWVVGHFRRDVGKST